MTDVEENPWGNARDLVILSLPSWKVQWADGSGLPALSGPFCAGVCGAPNSSFPELGPVATQLASHLLYPAERLGLLNDPVSVQCPSTKPDTEYTLAKNEFSSLAIF